MSDHRSAMPRLGAFAAVFAMCLLVFTLPATARITPPPDAEVQYNVHITSFEEITNDFTDVFPIGATADYSFEFDFVDLLTAAIFFHAFGQYDPHVGFDFTLENFLDEAVYVRIDLWSHMQPTYMGTPFGASADLTLTDGTSETEPDGSASFTSNNFFGMSRALVQATDGFSVFTEEGSSLFLFDGPDILAPGHYEEVEERVLPYDPPDLGYPVPWNRMLYIFEGSLSPGDSLAFSGRLNVAPEPAAAPLLMLGLLTTARRRRNG